MTDRPALVVVDEHFEPEHFTADRRPITVGMHVYTNDCAWGVVEPATEHDPAGWFPVRYVNGGRVALLNGERMRSTDLDGNGFVPPAPPPAPDYEYIGTVETAKLVRAALKKAFPTTKFKVRSDSYSMGSAVRVRWIDGPSRPAVEAVVKGFGGAGFDGMIDLKTHNEHWLLPDGTTRLRRSEIGHSYGTTEHELDAPRDDDGNVIEGARIVHFGADGIDCTRELSDELRHAYERWVVYLSGRPQDEPFEPNDRERYVFSIGGRVFHGWGSDLFYRVAEADPDELAEALAEENLRRDPPTTATGTDAGAPTPKEGTVSTTDTDKPAESSKLAAAETETVTAAAAVLDAADEAKLTGGTPKSRKKPERRTTSKAAAARDRKAAGKAPRDSMPDSVKESIADSVSKAAAKAGVGKSGKAKAAAAAADPEPAAAAAPMPADADRDKMREARAAGALLAEIVAEWKPRGYSAASVKLAVADVKPKRSSTAPAAPKRDGEDPLAITKEGPSNPRIDSKLAAIAPFLKRRRVEHFGKPESSHRALGYRYGISAQTAWRVCHERTFEKIAPAARSAKEPAELIVHDELPPARVRKPRKAKA